MKHFQPQVEIQDKVAIFSFTLMDAQLTSTQVLEFLEETATQSDELWAYRKEGENVEVLRPNGSQSFLMATAFELLYHSPDPKRIFDWMPHVVIRSLLVSGQTIPVIVNGKETNYKSLISQH